ncbi:MAG: histidine phosphatase family protein, partial [Actinomycetota bacterium]|nr:histidine phosphatase family protein [Actinomycetota bacterium]
SWGEPYRELARRMLAAVHRAREQAAGSEAVCVSHQLPIWTLRRYLTGQRLWHHPRRRQCALASLTSLVFSEDVLTAVTYTEPVGGSDPRQAGA